MDFRKYVSFPLVLSFISFYPITAHTLIENSVLYACDDIRGWPPYIYQDKHDPKKVTGAATDLVAEILKRANYDVKITLLPWEHCLSEVESGQKFSLLISASYSDERAHKFLFSKPLYTVHSGLIYLKNRFPGPPHILSKEDMHQYVYCGLKGYNYSMYALPEEQLDISAQDETERFHKLRTGQCDFVLGDLEVIKALEHMGKIDTSGTETMPMPLSSVHIPLGYPHEEPKKIHALISRWVSSGGGEALQHIFNKGLAHIKADGTYDAIMKRYGIENDQAKMRGEEKEIRALRGHEEATQYLRKD